MFSIRSDKTEFCIKYFSRTTTSKAALNRTIEMKKVWSYCFVVKILIRDKRIVKFLMSSWHFDWHTKIIRMMVNVPNLS